MRYLKTARNRSGHAVAAAAVTALAAAGTYTGLPVSARKQPTAGHRGATDPGAERDMTTSSSPRAATHHPFAEKSETGVVLDPQR